MNEYQNPAPAGGPPQGYYPPPPEVPLSAMAITGLVLGSVALCSSWMPIINNISFFIALLGAIFSIIGLVATGRGTKRGKVLAIVGLAISVLSIVVVLATQGMYGAVLDEAMSGSSAVGASTPSASRDTSREKDSEADAQRRSREDEAKQDFSNLSIGTTVQLDDGLSVTVLEVQTGLSDYDGSAITGVVVGYENGGSREASFNMFDWKAQDSQGAQRSGTFYLDGENELDSGSLAPGGTVSGTVYFEGDVVKVLYYSSIFSDSTIAWTVA